MTQFETSGTDAIVCPYCGYGHDPTDFGPSGSHECYGCGKSFFFEASYSVTYSTVCLICNCGEWEEIDGKVLWILQTVWKV